jgi:hypothetical protein
VNAEIYNPETEAQLRTATNPAVRAAADFDLYRICDTGRPAQFRTRSGECIDTRAAVVAVAGGIMGKFQPRETLPGGAIAERLDLSNYGLDWYLKQTT